MRSVSGESDTVLPWLLIRQDGHGNRYRVGSFATHTEAQQIAERLAKGGSGDADGYLVESMDPGGGAPA